jgi:hypothetical protein
MEDVRKVSYLFNAVELSALRNKTDWPQVQRALGYLSTWNMSFRICEISIQDGTDFFATYRDEENGPTKYVIGGIWREIGREYSFHS